MILNDYDSCFKLFSVTFDLLLEILYILNIILRVRIENVSIGFCFSFYYTTIGPTTRNAEDKLNKSVFTGI